MRPTSQLLTQRPGNQERTRSERSKAQKKSGNFKDKKIKNLEIGNKYSKILNLAPRPGNQERTRSKSLMGNRATEIWKQKDKNQNSETFSSNQHPGIEKKLLDYHGYSDADDKKHKEAI